MFGQTCLQKEGIVHLLARVGFGAVRSGFSLQPQSKQIGWPRTSFLTSEFLHLYTEQEFSPHTVHVESTKHADGHPVGS